MENIIFFIVYFDGVLISLEKLDTDFKNVVEAKREALLLLGGGYDYKGELVNAGLWEPSFVESEFGKNFNIIHEEKHEGNKMIFLGIKGKEFKKPLLEGEYFIDFYDFQDDTTGCCIGQESHEDVKEQRRKHLDEGSDPEYHENIHVKGKEFELFFLNFRF